MDSVLRGLSVYVFLLIVVRLSGRRTLGEMSAFDFVLLLMIGEATQQALLGEDFSLINAFLVIMTLVGADIALSFAKQRFKRLDQFMEGVPSVMIENGKVFRDRMEKARIDENDIMEAARLQLGLAQLSQIRHAVLEKTGSISVVPWSNDTVRSESRRAPLSPQPQ